MVRGFDLLVNTIGAYDGYQIIDIDDEETTRFQIETSGDWIIEVYPFTRSYVPVLDLPGKYEGNGDAVFVLGSGDPDLAMISTGSEEDNFVIYSYGTDSGKNYWLMKSHHILAPSSFP